MRYIYFHIDELNRDAIVASVLTCELNKLGWKVIYGNRFLSKLLKYFEWVFDVVILPKPMFISSIFNERQITRLRSKFVMLYTENIGLVANDLYPKMLLRCALDTDFMTGKTTAVDKVAAFCFWGSQVANIVTENYPSLKKRCHVVGHPRHDSRAVGEKDSVFKNPVEKSIGFITRFVAINDYYSRNPMIELVDRYLKDEIQYEYINEITNDFLINEKRGSKPDFDLFVEIIDIKNIALLIKRFKDEGFKISIKIHPRENPQVWHQMTGLDNEHLEIANSQIPFSDWVKKQKCVIGSPSTSFYDCFMLGVMPISIANLDSMRSAFLSKYYEENNKLIKHVIAPDSVEKIVDTVKNIKSEEFVMEQDVADILLAEANYPSCSESIDKLANVLREIIAPLSKRTILQSLGLYIYLFLKNILNYSGFLAAFVLKKKFTSAFFILSHLRVWKIKSMAKRK
jgi:surface carbohydrate biosynthesis protein